MVACSKHPGMLETPPFCTGRSIYLFIVKYIVILVAMTEKNIFPSTFRIEMCLNWVIPVELNSLEICLLFAYLHSLCMHSPLSNPHAACNANEGF